MATSTLKNTNIFNAGHKDCSAEIELIMCDWVFPDAIYSVVEGLNTETIEAKVDEEDYEELSLTLVIKGGDEYQYGIEMRFLTEESEMQIWLGAMGSVGFSRFSEVELTGGEIGQDVRSGIEQSHITLANNLVYVGLTKDDVKLEALIKAFAVLCGALGY
ncbi:hypothetical protein AB4254_10985 [Vibrio breoganii]